MRHMKPIRVADRRDRELLQFPPAGDTPFVVIAGVFFLGLLVYHIGAFSLWRDLAALGWGLALLTIMDGSADLFHAQAWCRCLSGSHRSLPFSRVLYVRMSGSAGGGGRGVFPRNGGGRTTRGPVPFPGVSTGESAISREERRDRLHGAPYVPAWREYKGEGS